eukprot:1413800-Pyramimonas_sp.AAC.1
MGGRRAQRCSGRGMKQQAAAPPFDMLATPGRGQGGARDALSSPSPTPSCFTCSPFHMLP